MVVRWRRNRVRTTLAHFALTPRVALQVHEDANQPGLFRAVAKGDRVEMMRGAHERVLDQVERIVAAAGESPREPIEPRMVRIEERSHALGGRRGHREGQGVDRRLSVHIYTDGQPRANDGTCRAEADGGRLATCCPELLRS
jgi:hypothetical protein